MNYNTSLDTKMNIHVLLEFSTLSPMPLINVLLYVVQASRQWLCDGQV